MNQKNREPGFYWVRSGEKWDVSWWSGYSWWLFDSDCVSYDKDLSEIDERSIVREEPSK